MKILYVSDVYFPRVNGVSTSIRTFVQELQALGHTVKLIAPDYATTTADEAWIQRVPSRGIYFDPEDRLMKSGKVLDTLTELRREQFDLIHIHTPFAAHYLGLRLGHLLDVPVIETYHTFFEDYLHHYLPWIPRGMAKSIARAISRRQCNQVDAIIAPSQPMLDALRIYGVNTPAEVIPTGLQAMSFAKADGDAFRTKHGIAPQRPMLLYVGRVAHEKNIDFLLEMLPDVIKRQPDVLLVIAGEGPAQAHLQHKTSHMNLSNHVKFIGYLKRETELNACYKSADIFVFASKSETQGLVLLEAMAQGTPVVALAEMGTKSILHEGEGAWIAPDNPQAFAALTADLLQDTPARTDLGQRAREYVHKHWTSRAQTERLKQFYKKIIKAGNKQL